MPREVRKDTLAGSSESDFRHGRFEPGQRLGSRYRIVALLGEGGMGQVYRADDLELGQSVALKFLPERVAADPSWLRRFRNEVRTARQVAHPNVCRIYDIAEQDGHVFLSMEYIDGEDLAGVLRRLGRPSREKAIEIARQICLGLAAAHENKVLHRDLKPANIMIDGRGHVRITDFGLAGFLDELEQVEARAGTPAYMAPEQLTRGKVSVRSDIYTLGLILHELFTGKCVFETNDIEELKRKHTSGSVTPPSSITEEIDPAVERVIMRCLQEEPEHRPQSVYQVLAALPGGDPLAAALAAGELPSPELVANARDAGGLRPPIAIGLLLATLLSLAVTYLTSGGKTVMPEKSPDELSVVAKLVMEELGYPDLPGNSVSGYDVSSVFSEPLQDESVVADNWAPRFRFWRRWTDGEFLAADNHTPEIFNYDGLTIASHHTATISIDPAGRLLGLLVTPASIAVTAAANEQFDPTVVFRRAGIDEADATQSPIANAPPVYCDDVFAWRIEDRMDASGKSVIMQVGTVEGRPNYVEFLGLDDMMKPGRMPQQIVTAFAYNMYVRQFFLGLMIVLAIRNLRAGRGDRPNALRWALIVGGLYCFMEILSLPFGSSITPARLLEFSNEPRGIGHIILHAVEGWVLYMAIEPYVRRVWPRMLVGVIRLLSGRVRDPAVGREVLLGVATGCGLAALFTAIVAAPSFQIQQGSQLPFWGELWSAVSPLHYLSMKAHRAAWVALDAAFLAGLLVAIRLLVRHTPAAVALGVGALSSMVYWWGFVSASGLSAPLAIAYSICCGTAIVLLYTKVGVLAGIVAVFVLVPSGLLTAGFGAWYTPYGMAELATLLALAACGFWVSLAGQPIFKDMLTEPQVVRP